MYTLLTRVIVGLVGPFAFKALCMDSQGDIPAIISQGESQDSQQSAFLHTRSGNLPISRHADTQDRALIKPEEWIVDKIDKLLIHHGLMLGGERVADTILLVDKLGYKELGLKKLLEDAVDTPTRVVVNKKLEELILPESPGNAEKEAVRALQEMLTSFWKKGSPKRSPIAAVAAAQEDLSVPFAVPRRAARVEAGTPAPPSDPDLEQRLLTLNRSLVTHASNTNFMANDIRTYESRSAVSIPGFPSLGVSPGPQSRTPLRDIDRVCPVGLTTWRTGFIHIIDAGLCDTHVGGAGFISNKWGKGMPDPPGWEEMETLYPPHPKYLAGDSSSLASHGTSRVARYAKKWSDRMPFISGLLQNPATRMAEDLGEYHGVMARNPTFPGVLNGRYLQLGPGMGDALLEHIDVRECVQGGQRGGCEPISAEGTELVSLNDNGGIPALISSVTFQNAKPNDRVFFRSTRQGRESVFPVFRFSMEPLPLVDRVLVERRMTELIMDCPVDAILVVRQITTEGQPGRTVWVNPTL